MHLTGAVWQNWECGVCSCAESFKASYFSIYRLYSGRVWCLCDVSKKFRPLRSSPLFVSHEVFVVALWDLSREKQVERLLKLQCATFHLQAEKGIVSSRPNTCHSPWWAVCLKTASRPRLRSLTAPKAATGVGEADAKPRNEGRKKRCWCSVCFWCKMSFTLCFAAAALVALTQPWQGQPQRWLHRQKEEFKCPEHHWKVRRTRGFTFE